jgi:Insecticide toxin TcdB middle/C-terminal region
LKGSVLRQEVYALDGSEESDRPYTVSESNSTIRMFQPRGCNLHGVFFAHAREAVTLNYERKLYLVGETRRADPRVTHAVTLEVDDYGNVLRSANLGYGRRFADPSKLLSDADRARQAKLLATVTENIYTNAVNEPAAYRTPATAETRVYELIHLEPGRRECDGTSRIGFNQLRRQVARLADGFCDLPCEDVNATGATGSGTPEVSIEATHWIGSCHWAGSSRGHCPAKRIRWRLQPGSSPAYFRASFRGLNPYSTTAATRICMAMDIGGFRPAAYSFRHNRAIALRRNWSTRNGTSSCRIVIWTHSVTSRRWLTTLTTWCPWKHAMPLAT